MSATTCWQNTYGIYTPKVSYGEWQDRRPLGWLLRGLNGRVSYERGTDVTEWHHVWKCAMVVLGCIERKQPFFFMIVDIKGGGWL